ncbi:MAG: hypothetical protein GWO07_14635 [Candidatus Dadabacteria bacterium]|nr:hypothetical protein [Candidatus Dadabacteria bacterium]NIS09948.1 hypothetical protein [Candidatus Dadabacteria bacterium]NIV41864.1 hypothetical protein [Candidatus Dadabacteria bacterium]NIY22923.1 hypothetical protein [Candidatus Dadabacteria bacterium]
MITHEQFEEMVYVYSVGALDGDDLEVFQKHLDTGCERCTMLLKENNQLVSVLPYGAAPETPPPGLQKKIMDSLAATKQYENREYKPSFWQRISPLWYGLGTAAACTLLLISVAFNYKFSSELKDKDSLISALNTNLEAKNNEIKSLSDQISAKDTELVSMQGVFKKYGRVADYLKDPNVAVINLVSLDPELKAVGRILWQTKENNIVFVSSNLPETPTGKIYQMWLIADGTPKSVGIFDVRADEETIVDLGKISKIENIKKFAVTLEPEGGVPQPTGQIYIAGDV